MNISSLIEGLRAHGLRATPVGLAVLLVCGRAQAWDSPEHVAISRNAYAVACSRLLSLPMNDDERARAQKVCVASPAPSGAIDECAHASAASESRYIELLYAATAPRGYPFAFADWISQGAALAGDYFKTPADFGSVSAQRDLPSLITYLGLASDNDDHFYPRVLSRMSEELVAAEELAENAHRASSPTVRDLLLSRAGVRLMFALHYAQDAFAAGHMGFNRAGSSAGPSQRLHAAFNHLGRAVENAAGVEFFVRGDRNLCRMDTKAQRMVVSASAATIFRVLATFTLGGDRTRDLKTVPPELSPDPDWYLPVYARVAPALAYRELTGDYIVAYNGQLTMQPLANVAGSARQSVTLGASSLYGQRRLAFGAAGMYITAREHEALIDWGIVGGAYLAADDRYRAEAGLGSRMGFLGTGVITLELCGRAVATGAWNEMGQHDFFFEPRAQILIELGEVFYVRLGGGYTVGTTFGSMASLDIGSLVGAYGGGSLDVRNISRGF